jgi:hypothetical protein
MASEPKPSAKPLPNYWERVLYCVFGALGCFLGVWLAPSITGWSHENGPDPFGALGGMGLGFGLASVLDGVVAGMRPGK